MIFSETKLGSFVQKMNDLGRNRIPFLFLIDFEMEKPVMIPLSEVDEQKIKFKFENINNYHLTAAPSLPPINFEKSPMPLEEYRVAFEYVQKELNYGNSFLTNLTFPTPIKTNYSLLQLFNKSRAKYKLYYKDEFIVFSPEAFIKIKDGIISSHPMKGTIEADIPNAKEILMADKKELAEHYTIVDLIRNDLGIVSEQVNVVSFRYLDLIKTIDKRLYQTSSHIEGKMPADFHENLGDILIALLPAGSISGAPKKKTVDIIQAAEKTKRGYYSGIMGHFDGKNLDSAVMIRYIEQTEDQLYFRSGCGITALSDCEAEYREMIDKVYVPIG
ncbi:MAG: aminodeoxychorismate synthase component I [Saprospiraceae bacterium]